MPLLLAFKIVLLLIFSIFIPPPLLHQEAITKQIDSEYLTLNSEFRPLLVYLKEYKKINGVYPDDVSGVFILNSKTFNGFEYSVTKDKKGYNLEVYPVGGVLSYYYSDERDNGYNYYVSNGYYDGFLDNEYFFKIDKTWHGVLIEYFL